MWYCLPTRNKLIQKSTQSLARAPSPNHIKANCGSTRSRKLLGSGTATRFEVEARGEKHLFGVSSPVRSNHSPFARLMNVIGSACQYALALFDDIPCQWSSFSYIDTRCSSNNVPKVFWWETKPRSNRSHILFGEFLPACNICRNK